MKDKSVMLSRINDENEIAARIRGLEERVGLIEWICRRAYLLCSKFSDGFHAGEVDRRAYKWMLRDMGYLFGGAYDTTVRGGYIDYKKPPRGEHEADSQQWAKDWEYGDPNFFAWPTCVNSKQMLESLRPEFVQTHLNELKLFSCDVATRTLGQEVKAKREPDKRLWKAIEVALNSVTDKVTVKQMKEAFDDAVAAADSLEKAADEVEDSNKVGAIAAYDAAVCAAHVLHPEVHTIDLYVSASAVSAAGRSAAAKVGQEHYPGNVGDSIRNREAYYAQRTAEKEELAWQAERLRHYLGMDVDIDLQNKRTIEHACTCGCSE